MEDSLVSAVIELDQEKVIKFVKQELKNGKDSKSILERIQTGVVEVGKRYSKGEYFIADLIMSGMIFKEVLKYIDFQKDSLSEFSGLTIVFATVEKDIHDVGKNVTISFYQSRGINVIDLGVDVPAADIVEEVQRSNASIVCLSGLLTVSYQSMKKTVELLKKKHLRKNVKVIIGGNVDENVREYVGADYWTTDFVHGLEICRKIAGELKEANGNISSDTDSEK